VDQRQAITTVAFGDSITAAGNQDPGDRWPEILRGDLQEQFPEREITMVNAGVGGNTSREGLSRFEQDVLVHDPHFVLVEFGNDATPEPDRHVSCEKFVSNLNAIKKGVEERSGGCVVLLTFPPIIDHWHSWYENEFYQQNGGQDAYQENYREATRRLSSEHGMPLADIDRALRTEMSVRGPGECILPDGVHLTARGNQCVAETVLAVLSPEIAKLVQTDAGADTS